MCLINLIMITYIFEGSLNALQKEVIFNSFTICLCCCMPTKMFLVSRSKIASCVGEDNVITL